ncbi:hypothetical protein LTR08_006342 [Meristemomyces frigidus]|nr:hypothetical protein LTR08_006342 [Meristemomyces frigidus]
MEITTEPSVGKQMAMLIGLRESDKRAFDYFVSRTAPCLAGVFDKDFWCGYVLQIAHSERYVLDSLVAISTLYEHPQYLVYFASSESEYHPGESGMKVPDVRTASDKEQTLDSHHADALKSYNRAMRTFRQSIESGEGTPLLALLSCVLFITIEIIRDDVAAALTLWLKGSGLLKQFANLKLEGLEQQLFVAIREIFVRLSVSAGTFGHPLPILQHAEVYVDAVGNDHIFTFEMGAVAPLYIVASMCRIPSLRRKALQLLARAPRKEFMWGATSTAQLIVRLIAIEEENIDIPIPLLNGQSEDGTLHIDDSVLPSESDRIQSYQMFKDSLSRIRVRVTRYREEHDGFYASSQDYAI